MTAETIKRRVTWKGRFLAVAFGTGVLVLAEALCRWANVDSRDPAVDPFVGFSRVEPLFALNPKTQRYEIRQNRLRFFVADSFARAKQENTKRIFCLGGSTVQGRPYARETSFPTALQMGLEYAAPDLQWEIVNCGGVSYASYRLVPILKECLEHDPDLIIVCTGHNEFLEERSYSTTKKRAAILGPVRALADRSRLFSAGQNLISQPESQTPVAMMKTEADALLDYRRGLEAYHRDDVWHAGVVTHFANNLDRMTRLCRQAGVPVLLLSPPCNLRDTTPFKSVLRENLSPESRAEVNASMQSARQRRSKNGGERIASLRKVIELDNRNAEAYFFLGEALLGEGRFTEARKAFWRAVEEDVCPLRMLPEMREKMLRICEKHSVPYRDLHVLLEKQSGYGIAGGEWFVDHIHPSIRGHELIGRHLLPTVLNLLEESVSSVDWEAMLAEGWTVHVNGLPPVYFAHGRRRLNNLRAWTHGMTDGPPIEKHRALPHQTTENP